MKRILLILTASAAFLLLLFLIIGHATPKDLDERAEEALEYCKGNGYWRFRSKGPQKTDDYFGVKPPKKDSIINKKGMELGSRASNFRSIATQFS